MKRNKKDEEIAKIVRWTSCAYILSPLSTFKFLLLLLQIFTYLVARLHSAATQCLGDNRLVHTTPFNYECWKIILPNFECPWAMCLECLELWDIREWENPRCQRPKAIFKLRIPQPLFPTWLSFPLLFPEYCQSHLIATQCSFSRGRPPGGILSRLRVSSCSLKRKATHIVHCPISLLRFLSLTLTCGNAIFVLLLFLFPWPFSANHARCSTCSSLGKHHQHCYTDIYFMPREILFWWFCSSIQS